MTWSRDALRVFRFVLAAGVVQVQALSAVSPVLES
jgi:hypothetical protein